MLKNTNFLIFLTLIFSLAALSATGAIASGVLSIPSTTRNVIAPLGEPLSGFVFYNRKLIAETLGKARRLLLTFDDGPNPHTTPIVLDILKRWNLKCVFFLVGMNVRKYPGLVKRIYDEGHTIGNHTYYHIDLRRQGAERILREIRETNDLITQITGARPRLFRPPYGALNTTIVSILRQENMSIMLWTFDPRDWRNRSMAQTVASLRKQIHLDGGGKGGVILLHDTLPSTANALEPLLAALSQCNLLPSPYLRDPPHGRAFWAAKQPSVLHAFRKSWDLFNPEVTGRRLLVRILNPPPKVEFSAIALLRAKKSGQLFSALLCRAF
ncbi:hypothetical protein AUK22_02530 [bacterium CG2_30_54_10]|nr:MAG: hypothetical protein AUK22_02530 [bacterium CG2_30_54_10]